MLPGAYNNNVQLVQTPGYVAILNEMIHEHRIVPLDGRPHIHDDIRQWNGDTRGHWEGNTLVVDTTNFTDTQEFRGVRQGTLHLVERFTRVDATTIDYEVTIDDPTMWTRPWTFLLPWQKDDSYEMFEYACHEGNYSMEGILAGARAQEKARLR